ncbi:hypothetical protein V2G26_006536 [Clonostachys chloroleuca]
MGPLGGRKREKDEYFWGTEQGRWFVISLPPGGPVCLRSEGRNGRDWTSQACECNLMHRFPSAHHSSLGSAAKKLAG